MTEPHGVPTAEPVYMTEGLASGLLRAAAAREPEQLTLDLGTTPAPADVAAPEGTPVFTHFYHPETAASTRAVFGIDLSIPFGRSKGRFVSHPRSSPRPTVTDDFHHVLFIAVPPWDDPSLRAFTRGGVRRPVRRIEWTPPDPPVLGEPSSE